MKKTNIWIFALPMMLGLASCSVSDNPVNGQPAQSTEREQFEQQLTKTLDNYYTLLHTFDSPYHSIQDLVKALEQKGKEIADAFKF